MTIKIRKMALASVAALALTASMPVVQSFGPPSLAGAALARGGHDDGGSSSSSGSGSSGRSGGNHGSDDHGGRSGGHDDDGNDDHGGRRGDRASDDGASHDVGDDNPGNHGGRRNRDRSDRPQTVLTVSDASLRGLLNGSLVARDQLGRLLEVEVEREHGARIIKAQVHRSDARRNPGAITSVQILPAAAQ
ncbi:hypothetical protein FZ934_17765 [Rhizobium grahamii]|uniref:Uncharacterized protein n=1 Tax=Rhizobium grahamii TaxID=1120045 RepID=A0A5Q0CE56_9HYPH|nr:MULTISPECIES: hypothetical protein [Rhizobium]QFY62079.1 hypothetical protein FZ934_17765 [Rhizobium grahamii]QRM48741.1 hypothetical protein F3Y33_05130 [Rhizobium sp. BG6]